MKPTALIRTALFALATASATPAIAAWDSIGLFFDPECGTCAKSGVIPNVPFELYVSAELRNQAIDGTFGAEFRIAGLPTDWLVVELRPNPDASIVLGNPFGVGIIIGFDACQSDQSGCVNLFSALIWPTSSRDNVRLRVESHANPACPGFCCPFLVKCDAPVFTHLCATGGQAWINGPSCTVGAALADWSNVKQLYR